MTYRDKNSEAAKQSVYNRNQRYYKSANEKRRASRLKIIELLGNKCEWCGFSDIRALQIDHVEGSGTEHRRKYQHNMRNYYVDILNHVMSGNKAYQVLCANCNQIKRHINHEDDYNNWRGGDVA